MLTEEEPFDEENAQRAAREVRLEHRGETSNDLENLVDAEHASPS